MITVPKEMKLFVLILALTALGLGFSNDIISNYFKDAYQATAFQRGIIELPRELPGILCILVISLFSFISDIRIAILVFIGFRTGFFSFETPTLTLRVRAFFFRRSSPQKFLAQAFEMIHQLCSPDGPEGIGRIGRKIG